MADEKTDSTAASSTAVVEPPEIHEDPFALPEDVKDEKSKARFQTLVDRAKQAEEQLKGYADLGKPEEIAEFVQYTRGLEAQLEALNAKVSTLEDKRETGQPKTEEQKKAEANAQNIQQALEEAYPFLKEAKQFVEQQRAKEQQRIQALTADAVEDTAAVMKEYGMATSKEKVLAMCDVLEPIIRKNPRLAFRFERNPEGAIRSAMQIYVDNAKEIVESRAKKDSAEQQRSKEKLTTLPRAHGGGGGPGDKTTMKEPANVGEGVRNALAAWRERGR